jgi:hypothetical protein
MLLGYHPHGTQPNGVGCEAARMASESERNQELKARPKGTARGRRWLLSERGLQTPENRIHQEAILPGPRRGGLRPERRVQQCR